MTGLHVELYRYYSYRLVALAGPYLHSMQRVMTISIPCPSQFCRIGVVSPLICVCQDLSFFSNDVVDDSLGINKEAEAEAVR